MLVNGIHHVCIKCRMDQCVKAVREAGYAITVEPKDVTLATTPPSPIRVAFCIGPVGEEIEFYQEK